MKLVYFLHSFDTELFFISLYSVTPQLIIITLSFEGLNLHLAAGYPEDAGSRDAQASMNKLRLFFKAWVDFSYVYGYRQSVSGKKKKEKSVLTFPAVSDPIFTLSDMTCSPALSFHTSWRLFDRPFLIQKQNPGNTKNCFALVSMITAFSNQLP